VIEAGVPNIYPTRERLSIRIVRPSGVPGLPRGGEQDMLEALHRSHLSSNHPSNAIDHRKNLCTGGDGLARLLGGRLGKRQGRLRPLRSRRRGNRRHSHGAEARLRPRTARRRSPRIPPERVSPPCPHFGDLWRLPLPATQPTPSNCESRRKSCAKTYGV